MRNKINILWLSLIIAVMPIFTFGQCPESHIVLSSQADVDAFTLNYPNCSEIILGLTISGDDITDLTPLEVITSIDSRLHIENNLLLTNLSGLESLLEINPLTTGGLRIINNAALTDISALSNMVVLNNYGGLNIVNNPSLLSLNGLQGSSGFLLDGIAILNNDSLTSLDGLGSNIYCSENFRVSGNDSLLGFGNINFDFLGGLHIEDNTNLSDISVLNNYGSTIYNISVMNNPNLSVCNVLPFCNRIDEMYQCCNGMSSDIIFENNDVGCNGVPEIAISCGIVPTSDNCSEALSLTLGEPLEAYNVFATESQEVPLCNDLNRVDVWFKFNTEGYATVDIVGTTGYHLQLWSGTCENLSQVNDACGTGSISNNDVSTNTDYYLQVWSDEASEGIFDIVVQDGLLSTPDDSLKAHSLYPNPTNGIVNFKSESPITQVKVFDLLGKEMFSSAPNSVIENVNLAKLNSGMYLVVVEINELTTVHRIVKE